MGTRMQYPRTSRTGASEIELLARKIYPSTIDNRPAIMIHFLCFRIASILRPFRPVRGTGGSIDRGIICVNRHMSRDSFMLPIRYPSTSTVIYRNPNTLKRSTTLRRSSGSKRSSTFPGATSILARSPWHRTLFTSNPIDPRNLSAFSIRSSSVSYTHLTLPTTPYV